MEQDKIIYNHGKVVNACIVYQISKHFNVSIYSTLENCFFGAVSLTKNANINRSKSCGYGTGFDRHGYFSHTSGETGRNVTIFGVDMSSSTKIDNRKKDILTLGKNLTQWLEHTLSAEKMHSISFTVNNEKFALACIIMERIIICLLMVQISTIQSKGFWDCSNSIILRQQFKSLVSR